MKILHKFFNSCVQILFPASFQESRLEQLLEVQHYHGFSSLFSYQQGYIQTLIRHMKNYISPSLSRYLANHCYNLLSRKYDIDKTFLLIVAMPLSSQRQRARGFNQVHLLCSYLAQRHPHLYYDPYLVNKVDNQKQALLTKQERIENMKKVFSISKLNSGTCRQFKHAIIIDDLVTTGASKDSLTECLQQSGINNVYTICIAH